MNRLIENWLTNTIERGFELPFAQLLQSQGYTIVHIDSHSPQEQGKDITAIDKSKKACGFQIKQGNISGSRWDREIQPELTQLVEAASIFQSTKGKLLKPFLVTTGTLNGPAQLKLSSYNEGLKWRKLQAVQLIDKHVLTTMFASAFGKFLPLEFTNVRRLLKFYLENPNINLDKTEFYKLITDFPDLGERPGNIKKYIGGLPILCSYAISPAATAQNHYVQLEAWTLTASKILQASLVYKCNKHDWEPTYKLCRDEATAVLRDLTTEAIEHKSLMEGSTMGDGGPVWQARVTILLGIVAASELINNINQVPKDESRSNACRMFIEKNLQYFFNWGESSCCNAWMIYFYMRSNQRTNWTSEVFLAQYAKSIAIQNGKSGIGLADPHKTADECLLRIYGDVTTKLPAETSYTGAAYAVRPIIYELARALNRTQLNDIWFEASGIQHAHFNFKNQYDYLNLTNKEGHTNFTFLSKPTKWNQLRKKSIGLAKHAASSLPQVFKDDLVFSILFSLTCPHRMDENLTSLLSDELLKIPS